MRHTILRGAVFLAVWFLILAVLALAGERMAPVYPELKARKELLRAQSSSLEAISFGASHAAALDFRILGLNGFHFWNNGADFHQLEFLASELLDDLPRLGCVLISLSPYQLDSDNGANAAPDRRAQRRELYARERSLRFIRGDLPSFIAGKASHIARPDHWRKAARSMLYGPTPPPVRSDGMLLNGTAASTPPGRMVEDARATADTHARQREGVLRDRPEARRTGRSALSRLVQRAVSQGADVVLYTAPFHSAYLNAVDRQILTEMRAYGAELAETGKGVIYLDYSTVDELTGAAEYFRDPTHLNDTGARAFNRRLRDDVAESRCAGSTLR